MNKPNLIIPGFPKSGTSALHAALTKHDEIFDGGKKEPHTYSWENRFIERSLFFKDRYGDESKKYIIDSSTTYLVSDSACSRILKDSPNAKFIIIARDPIDRIVSHYNWLSSLNLINKKPIEELNNHLTERFNYKNHYSGNYKAYIDFSSYGKHLKRLLELTNKENVLFFTYEELFKGFELHQEKFEDFLELNLEDITFEKVNETNFNEKKLIHKSSLGKKILLKLQYEYRILTGYQKGLRVNNPKKHKVTRSEIEDFLIPYLKEDILELKDLGYGINSWQTYRMLNNK